ncbi:methyltransferase domain-containing protein [Actinomadura rubrisoli]|uniref:Protein-L-isoaspartate O-methyltransferase n=1 Tax=Actinomadura rubrisoli TaxID=2530368 RepID=A0A4R5C5G8_9ACTN|nr:methyltransferase domain-containing protein [Actinomadura rubrisoli]TDD92112.1 methyltransferase domain-containing protein [Actinomadura rubrisoli]
MEEARITALADAMAAKNLLPDDRWHEALYAAPRHLFVPARGWLSGGDGEDHPIDREARPEEWWQAAYADAAIVIQTDDGAGEHTTGEGRHTSSLSAPSAVFWSLGELLPEDHHRVLEIGTGTGWTAALLSHRVGQENVSSVEVDEALAKQAAVNLDAAGFAPHLIVGDGGSVTAAGGPFDRVLSTCSVAQVPHVWLQQCRPGAVIVTPFQPWFGWGHLARLAVLADGTAVGRFPTGANYMMMRSQRYSTSDASEWMTAGDHDSTTRTKLDPRTIAWAPAEADLVISALVPGVLGRRTDDAFWLLDGSGPGGPWALATYEAGNGTFEVRQAGDRRLWEEVEGAYLTWLGCGQPERSRFGLTVSPEGQTIWLDSPDNPINS